jgi:hypothetical protein
MHALYELLTHRAVSIATGLLVLLLARSLLRQRRPAGNLIAWLANKPAPPPAISDSVSCQSGPIGQAPAGADLEVVVCTPRSK